MAERQVILASETALVGEDLELSFRAVRADKAPEGILPRFKKKEEISRMTKSILKHKIQTLTGKNIKQLEVSMGYKPKDPNEPSMDIDTMRRLATSLVLQAAGELPDYPEGEKSAPAPAPTSQVGSGKKRSAPAPAEAGSTKRVARKSLGALNVTNGTPAVNGSVKKQTRRSIAVISRTEEVKTPARTPGRRSKKSDLSSVSEVSQSVTTCLGPDKEQAESLAVLEEDEGEEEVDASLNNPTPMMKEMMKKRKSTVQAKKSPVKAPSASKTPAKTKTREREPSPPARQEFPCHDQAKVYLVQGDPLSLRFSKLMAALPLSAALPGFQLTLLHTPLAWTPPDVFSLARQVKTLNKEAGLNNFVLIVGTGLTNANMNMEALERHTKHVQFVTFHREDQAVEAGQETGKLRETTTHFLTAYFFPGCEVEGSVLPSKMVRDGYTTSFRCDSAAHLESSIIDCFTEQGEWILDLCPGKRKLVIAAGEKGRSAVALNTDMEELEDTGNYLRTISMKSDKTYRDKDGLVVSM